MAVYRWAVLREYFKALNAFDIAVAMAGGRLVDSVSAFESSDFFAHWAASDERMHHAAKALRNILPPSAGNSQRIVSGFHRALGIVRMRRTKSSE
jgi:heme-degrading monooxygenase HmoA